MVPNGWERIKLKDIGNCLNGLTYSPKDVVENGLLVLRSSNIQNSNLSFLDNVYVNIEVPEESRTRFGDIILCVRNGSKSLIGKSAFIGKSSEGLTHGAFMSSFRSNDTPEYTFQLFQSPLFFKQVNQNLGATINSINNGNLYNFNFPYPPIEERKKIATILGTWDKSISTTERLIDNSKQQKKALMQQLLTGRKRLLDDSGKPFEGKWEEVKLSNIANIIMGSSPKSSAYNEDSNGLPLLQGNADIKNRKSSPRIYTSEITKQCQHGDILLSVRAPVGTVAKSRHKACIGRGISAIKAKDKHSQEFIYQWLLRFEPMWEKYSQGSTFEAVNSNDIKSLSLAIPPLPEQQKISSVLTNADQEIELLEKQLADLKQEKKALMQQLLTGKRRVSIN